MNQSGFRNHSLILMIINKLYTSCVQIIHNFINNNNIIIIINICTARAWPGDSGQSGISKESPLLAEYKWSGGIKLVTCIY